MDQSSLIVKVTAHQGVLTLGVLSVPTLPPALCEGENTPTHFQLIVRKVTQPSQAQPAFPGLLVAEFSDGSHSAALTSLELTGLCLLNAAIKCIRLIFSVQTLPYVFIFMCCFYNQNF